MKMEEPVDGWIVGTVAGKPWFSNGHMMIVGKPPSKKVWVKLDAGKMDQVFNMLAIGEQKAIFKQEHGEVERKYGGKYLATVEFQDGIRIQKQYYDELRERFPNGVLYFGPKQDYMQGKARPIFCKDGQCVVAICQPILAP